MLLRVASKGNALMFSPFPHASRPDPRIAERSNRRPSAPNPWAALGNQAPRPWPPILGPRRYTPYPPRWDFSFQPSKNTPRLATRRRGHRYSPPVPTCPSGQVGLSVRWCCAELANRRRRRRRRRRPCLLSPWARHTTRGPRALKRSISTSIALRTSSNGFLSFTASDAIHLRVRTCV